MDLNKESLTNILSEITRFNDITLSDIPDIDLYMDQVTTLFEMKLNSLKRNEDDKLMTKTMINNYAKAKILPPVKSKKYNKTQIILLSLVYNLKQNLSLTDIQTVFTPILENIEAEDTTSPSINHLYDTFLSLKKDQLENFNNYFNQLTNTIKDKSENLEGIDRTTAELILLVFALISQANMQKRMAEKIIDNFFKSEV